MNLQDVINAITLLEQERQAIYADDQVTDTEHPRLAAIKQEIERLWDLRRRLSAAQEAGLSSVPVLPPADPNNLEQ